MYYLNNNANSFNKLTLLSDQLFTGRIAITCFYNQFFHILGGRNPRTIKLFIEVIELFPPSYKRQKELLRKHHDSLENPSVVSNHKENEKIFRNSASTAITASPPTTQEPKKTSSLSKLNQSTLHLNKNSCEQQEPSRNRVTEGSHKKQPHISPKQQSSVVASTKENQNDLQDGWIMQKPRKITPSSKHILSNQNPSIQKLLKQNQNLSKQNPANHPTPTNQNISNQNQNSSNQNLSKQDFDYQSNPNPNSDSLDLLKTEINDQKNLEITSETFPCLPTLTSDFQMCKPTRKPYNCIEEYAPKTNLRPKHPISKSSGVSTKKNPNPLDRDQPRQYNKPLPHGKITNKTIVNQKNQLSSSNVPIPGVGGVGRRKPKPPLI